MNVGIIGASGYLGGRLAIDLRARGLKVTTFSRSWSVEAREMFSTPWDHLLDVTEPGFAAEIASHNLDVVILTVSLDHRRSQAANPNMLDTNVSPSLKLVQALTSRKTVMVYLSTAQVYTKPSQSAGSHPVELAPDSFYGYTHLVSEAAFLAAQGLEGGVVPRILRLSNVVGPPAFATSNCWTLVANELCLQTVTQGIISLKSDGSPRRDFVSMQHFLHQTYQVVTNPNKYSTIQDIRSGSEWSVLELARLVREVWLGLSGVAVPIRTPASEENLEHAPATNSSEFDLEVPAATMFPQDLRSEIEQTLLYVRDHTAELEAAEPQLVESGQRSTSRK